MVDQEKATDFDHMVEELQRQIIEQERAIYSAKVIEEAYHPKNLGRMAEPDAYGRVHCPALVVSNQDTVGQPLSCPGPV